MKHNPLASRSWFFVSVLVLGLFATLASAQLPDIEGTYKLVSRTLPDGTVLYPPDVVGLTTMMDGYRVVNVFWKDAEGEMVAVSLGSTYTLTATELSETSLFRHTVNLDGGGIVNDFTSQTDTSPIKVEGARIELKYPLGAPLHVFEGNTRTTTIVGDWTEIWERIQ
jgi:hypothetical protein